MHIVLKSTHARDEWNLLSARNSPRVDRVIRLAARKCFVRVQAYVNVGNHLHLKIRANNRQSLQKFHRWISALIARAVTGSTRGKPLADKFWTSTIFTRVLSSRYEERVLRDYFQANLAEAVHGRAARDTHRDEARQRRRRKEHAP